MAENQDNKAKSEHGLNGKNGLVQMVSALKARNYIRNYIIDYRIADPNYGEKQFFFQVLVEFDDDKSWILHSTTSVRDRITEQQWNSSNIKRLNNYVEKALVVVPDSLPEKEKNIAEAYNNKIQEKKIFSALDGVVTFGIAYQMIEHKGAELMGRFSGKACLGLHFEEKIAASLNSRDNFEIWHDGRTTKTGYLYEYFKLIMESTNISKDSVVGIYATSDIPKLPSGGSPKTDVYLEVEMLDGTKSFTYSCKRSSEKRVSVHEYTAEAFSKVLNPDDDELKILLYEFQTAGGVRAMLEESATRLEEKLNGYTNSLSKWVLGGIGGEGDSKTQWASHIITVSDDTDECKIYSIDDYIQLCGQQGIEGQLGTLFQWTYPSGGKGKKIQLKCRLL